MSVKQFLIPKKVENKLNRLPSHIRKRIPDLFLRLEQNPLLGVKLHGELAGYFKYRLGDYRIVYMFDAKIGRIEVVVVEHRQGVYK